MSRPWVMPLDAREVVAVDVDVWEALEAERDALRARVAELDAAAAEERDFADGLSAEGDDLSLQVTELEAAYASMMTRREVLGLLSELHCDRNPNDAVSRWGGIVDALLDVVGIAEAGRHPSRLVTLRAAAHELALLMNAEHEALTGEGADGDE